MDREQLDQALMIVGARFSGGVPGAKRYACLFCQQAAWLSPGSQPLLHKPRSIVICLDCYLTNSQTPEPTETRVSNPQELISTFGPQLAEWIATQGVKRLQEMRRANRIEPWKQ